MSARFSSPCAAACACTRWACARSAASVCPEITQGRTVPAGRLSAVSSGAVSSGVFSSGVFSSGAEPSVTGGAGLSTVSRMTESRMTDVSAPTGAAVADVTPAGAAGSWGAVGRAAACSRTTCAFVPLIPKEDTTARRGRSTSGQGVGAVSSRTAPAAQSTCEEGSSTCRVAGSRPWCIASAILITPATPAAAWVCPMFDLIDPSHSGRSAGRSRP